MTPKLLSDCGEALYGPRWQSELARDLDVDDRTMRRWVAGDSPVPNGVAMDLLRLLTERASDIDDLIPILKQQTPVSAQEIDDAMQRTLTAVSQQGYANGLKAAAILLEKMAADHTRGVGTNAIRDLAAALRDKAAALRRSATEQIAALEKSSA